MNAESLNVTKQKVAVFGSWRSAENQRRVRSARGLEEMWSNQCTKEVFERACKDLGAEIARAGNTLIVASDSPSTVDYHCGWGVIDAGPFDGQEHASLHVLRSRAKRSSTGDEDCSLIFEAEMNENPWAFLPTEDLDENRFPLNDKGYSNWDDIHEYAAENADKVLVIGGGSSTHRIANVALANGLKVVPIGTFGGAAADILKMVESVRDTDSLPPWEYRQTLSTKDWGDQQKSASLYALGVWKDPKRRTKVFINYRRSDSKWPANMIKRELNRVMPDVEIFLDTDDMRPATQFTTQIRSELSRTRVLVCIIGSSWLSATVPDGSNRRRIDDKEDYVRREIIVGLEENAVDVLPVFVDEIESLRRDTLPPEIGDLAEIHGIRINADSADGGLKTLINAIQQIIG